MLRFNPITGEIDIAPTSSPRQGPRGLRGTPGVDGKPGAPGRDGKDGQDGQPGCDGRDGVDGKDGRDGRDGVANTIRHGYHPPGPTSGNPGDFFILLPRLVFYGPMRLDRTWPEGVCLHGAPGEPGKDGAPGKDGRDGRNGKDGKDGAPGPRGERGFTSQPSPKLDPASSRPSITVAAN